MLASSEQISSRMLAGNQFPGVRLHVLDALSEVRSPVHLIRERPELMHDVRLRRAAAADSGGQDPEQTLCSQGDSRSSLGSATTTAPWQSSETKQESSACATTPLTCSSGMPVRWLGWGRRPHVLDLAVQAQTLHGCRSLASGCTAAPAGHSSRGAVPHGHCTALLQQAHADPVPCEQPCSYCRACADFCRD